MSSIIIYYLSLQHLQSLSYLEIPNLLVHLRLPHTPAQGATTLVIPGGKMFCYATKSLQMLGSCGEMMPFMAINREC